MERLHTICRRTYALQNLQRKYAQKRFNNAPLMTNIRFMSEKKPSEYLKHIKYDPIVKDPPRVETNVEKLLKQYRHELVAVTGVGALGLLAVGGLGFYLLTGSPRLPTAEVGPAILKAAPTVVESPLVASVVETADDEAVAADTVEESVQETASSSEESIVEEAAPVEAPAEVVEVATEAPTETVVEVVAEVPAESPPAEAVAEEVQAPVEEPAETPIESIPEEVAVVAPVEESPVAAVPVEEPIAAAPDEEQAIPVEELASAAPVEELAVTVPVEEPVAPVEESAAPVEEPAAPVEETAAVAPVEEPVVVAPVEEPVAIAPVEEPVVVAPVEEPVAVAPVEEPVAVAPVEEPVAVTPVEEPVTVAPVEEPVAVAPVEEPAVPAEEPAVVAPVEEPVIAAPIEESPSAAGGDSDEKKVADAVAAAVLEQSGLSIEEETISVVPQQTAGVPLLETPADEVVPVLPAIPEHAQYLLVGAGTAAFGAFRAIKSRDPKAKILIIGEEDTVPYMRPPLSKELWFNDDKEEVENMQFKQWNGKKRSIFYEPKEFFASPAELNTLENGGIALLTGKKVVKVDAAKKKVWLASGETLTYDKCLLATGGKPRNHPALSASDPEVQKRTFLFRNVEDFKNLDKLTGGSGSVAIIGGGFLGSELACALGKRGKDNGLKVYQLFPEKGNMGKVLPEYLSKWTTKKVENEGVTVLANHNVLGASFEDGKVKLDTKEGGSIIVDGIVTAVGLEPNVELASASGLETDRKHGGYLVNAELEARRDLWVAGDAACFYDVKLGRRRVEHHDHAVVSGRLAGENMTGAAKPYWHQSMFWSDLGPNVGYEAIGICDSSLQTVAVFAKASEADTPKAVVEQTGENLRSESTDKETGESLGSAPAQTSISTPLDQEEYGKGIVFYLNDKKVVVGMLLWNTFNKMSIARQILKDGAKNEDLYEVAKLFDIYDTLDES